MTSSPPTRPSRIRRIALMALIGAVAGFLGVWAGQTMRQRTAPTPTEDTGPPASLLELGAPFPEVPLLDGDSRPVRLPDLLPEGGVVIFLEPGCPPCSLISHTWQDSLDAESPPAFPVIGIAAASPSGIERWRVNQGLTFPIYSDPGRIYTNEWQVVDYPLQVVVDRSLRIIAQTHESASPVPVDAIGRMLARR